MSKTYCIGEGYKINPNNGHHDDRNYTEEGQKEVYVFAKELMGRDNLTTVVDVGCGSGFKLIKYLGEFNTVGYEVEPVLSSLNVTYPDRLWIDSGTPERSFEGEPLKCDLVVCADVVEHIKDPDVLLDYLKQFKSTYILISTPCRHVLCTNTHLNTFYIHSFNGPPVNGAHVREWTFDEFKEYLSEHFEVLESHMGKEQVELQYHLLRVKNG